MIKEEFFQLARKRFREAETADSENHTLALADLKFIHNHDNAQWPAAEQRARAVAGRPTLTNNLLRKFLRSLMGAMKQANPGIKVKPVDSNSDLIVADILESLIRQIETDNEYPANQAYSKAYEGALGNSFGYWRIVQDFENENSFNQKLQIRRVPNPFTVHYDPGYQNLLPSDARYCFVHTVMDKVEFKDKWPKANPGEPDNSLGESNEGWFMEDSVRVAEYFYAVPVVRELGLLDDYSVVELDENVERSLILSGRSILKRKKTVLKRYMWTKLSGNEILEPSRLWPGRFIPVIPVFGDEVNIEGKRMLYSFFRDSQDPQKMYNFWLTAATELVALAPKAPHKLTPNQIKGHEEMWKQANSSNRAYLLYNPDPKAPPPIQANLNALPSGALAMLNIAQQGVMNTSGLFESSIGQKSNERSGKAILARQAAGDRVTYSYFDNFLNSLLYTGYLLTDLIPKVYDTSRIIRLRGMKDAIEFININSPYFDFETGSVKVLHDLSVGSYDVELDAGSASASRRAEATQSMIEFLQYVPDAAPHIADLIAKNMDWPGAQEIAERLKSLQQSPQQ